MATGKTGGHALSLQIFFIVGAAKCAETASAVRLELNMV